MDDTKLTAKKPRSSAKRKTAPATDIPSEPRFPLGGVLSSLRQATLNINLGFTLIVILSFVLGWQFGHRDYTLAWRNYHPNITVTNQQPPDGTSNIDFSLFWNVWNLVSSKYIDKSAIDPQKMYYGAIQGMVAALGDPYTVFLPPASQQATQEELGGSFDGVGMELGYNKDNRLVVVAPLKDTPADKAGIKAGDLILQINGKDTTNMTLPDAVNLIRGPKGSNVMLNILHENDGAPQNITITRDTITVKSVYYSAETTPSGKKVAYIQITTFGENTRTEWDDAVNQALADNPSGLIIDVRNNPGGYLDDAIYIASDLLDGGNVVLEEDAMGNRQAETTVKTGRLLNIPVVVLINKGSASASEILSGAIQDRKRGVLVGEQSFGKGTIQTTEDLPGGTGLHITTAKWLTPNGRWINHTGLTPDYVVDRGTDPAKDPQLQKALELLN